MHHWTKFVLIQSWLNFDLNDYCLLKVSTKPEQYSKPPKQIAGSPFAIVAVVKKVGVPQPQAEMSGLTNVCRELEDLIK